MNYLYYYISSAETYIVNRKSEGTLHSITVGESAAGTITVSDDNGTIAVLKASIAEGTYDFDVAYNGQLKVITAAGSKITVAYN